NLNHTPISLSFAFHILFDTSSIDANVLLRARRGFWSGNLCECDDVFDRSRELDGFSMPADMHIHDPGRFVEDVVVEGSHVHAITFKHGYHRSYFVLREYQITHDHGASAGFAESYPSTK